MAYIKIDTVAYRGGFLSPWTDYELYYDPSIQQMKVVHIDGPDRKWTISESQRTKPNGTVLYQHCVGTTQFVIKSQCAYPYMYKEVNTNSGLCGYTPPPPTDPIPTPIIYGLKYRLEFTDIHATTPMDWRMDIMLRNYSGMFTQLTGAAKPLIIQYQGNEQDKLAPIIGSQVTVNIVNDGSIDISQFYNADEKEWKVLVYQNNTLYWAGYITPDDCQQPWLAAPYEFALKATDGLGLLKGIFYLNTDGTNITTLDSCLTIISRCLGFTDLNLNIITGVNIYEQDQRPVIQGGTFPADTLQTISVNYQIFLALNSANLAIDAYTALQMVVKTFGATVFQANGSWYIIRKNELIATNIYLRNYGTNIASVPAAVATNLSVGLGGANALTHCSRDQLLRINKAYLSVEVDFSYNIPSNLPFNGDFQLFTARSGDPDLIDPIGDNPHFWNIKGSVATAISKKRLSSWQDWVPCLLIYGNTSGEPITTNPEYVESFPFFVTEGDTFTFSGSGFAPSTNNINIAIVVSDGVGGTGDYYFNNSTKKFQTTPTYISFQGSGAGTWTDISVDGSAVLSFIPVSGSMYLRLYQNSGSGSADAQFAELRFSYILSGNPNTTGTQTILKQLGQYSEQFQDNVPFASTRHTLIPGSLFKLVHGVITLTQKWFRYDRNTESKRLDEILAQSILNMYGVPSKIFEGSIYGNQYSYANTLVINADAAGVKYGFVNWDYDVKACINRATSIQLLDAEIANTEQFIFEK